GAVRLWAGALGHARARDPAPHRPLPGPAAPVPAAHLSPLPDLPRQAVDRDAAVRPAVVRQVAAGAALARSLRAPGDRARLEPARAAWRLAVLRRPGTVGRAPGRGQSGRRRGARRPVAELRDHGAAAARRSARV